MTIINATDDSEEYNMKTRIISGILIALVIIAIISAGFFYSIVFSVAAALLGAVCVFELLYNTGYCKNDPLIYTAALFAVLSPFINKDLINIEYTYLVSLFVVAVITITLIKHKDITPINMFSAIALPIMVAYSFRSIVLLSTQSLSGIYNLALLLCFTVFADIGAYFVGVFFGKHKMSPNISPKKTYEGLVGGLVVGTIFTIIVTLLFRYVFKLVFLKTTLIIIIAPLFILFGVMGDLIASYIKRGANIKDFGDTIPGHGGIMDRFDSMLIVSPALYIFDSLVNISGI